MNLDSAIDKINSNTMSNFYVELPNSIENVKFSNFIICSQILIKGFKIFQDKIKNLSNYNDILAKLEEFTKSWQNYFQPL